jgi:hypothetical protein
VSAFGCLHYRILDNSSSLLIPFLEFSFLALLLKSLFRFPGRPGNNALSSRRSLRRTHGLRAVPAVRIGALRHAEGSQQQDRRTKYFGEIVSFHDLCSLTIQKLGLPSPRAKEAILHTTCPLLEGRFEW